MKRVFYLSVLIFLVSLQGIAQNFSVSGIVKQFGAPAKDVRVSVSSLGIQTHTDQTGYYQLELPKGSYVFTFDKGSQMTFTLKVKKDAVLNVELSDEIENLDEIFISAYRVDADSPISYSNLSNREIEERNLGQDIPVLMNFMPSVVSTSDAGAGIGYTGIRVRGSDATRINTTINGVPLNDGESQGVFWVNLGDFTSSVENLQLQRGVGTSTNGAGAFGASLNILTPSLSEKPEVELTNTFGSFNTHKHHLKFDTGLLKDRFSLSGSLGMAKSDGYRDRSFSNLKSYMLQGGYQHGNTFLKVLSFGGSEQTYQAYYGLTKEQVEENRRFNPAGMYTDKEGNTQFYENQTDNYKQDHLQVLWNQRYNSKWSSNLTFHYTYGRGYYESYQEDGLWSDYGLAQKGSAELSDLVNQKWLDNHFMGTVFDVTYKTGPLKTTLGGGWSRYWGDHYGTVIWVEDLPQQEDFGHYYDNRADKRDYNLYLKTTWALNDQFAVFADLQGRGIRYRTAGPYEGQEFALRDHFSFFNPKAGMTYQMNTRDQFYFSFARANKEPNRTDYKTAVLSKGWDGQYPKAERLDDWEVGWRRKTEDFVLNANLYYMDYHNQLVLTGEMDPEGRALRKNSGSSYRLGLEIESTLQISSKWSFGPNLTLSRNRNRDFLAEVDGEPTSYGNTQISFSPSVIFGGQLRYTPTPNLTLNWLSKYVGKQYMSNLEVEESRLDGYFTSDLNLQYKWQKVPWFREAVFTGLVNNLLDAQYSSNGAYSSSWGATYYPQAGINFIAGLSLRF